MADPDSPELLFKRALAQYLEDQGCGVYNHDGANYTLGQRGIFTNGPTLPTGTQAQPKLHDDCIVLTSLKPISDGRGNLIYRIQAYTRVKGSNITAGNAAALVTAAIDHKENVPPGMNVSWAESFSRLEFEPDTSQRSAVAETFHFRGRR